MTTLRWTRERPTVPGFYWCVQLAVADPFVAQVYARPNGQLHVRLLHDVDLRLSGCDLDAHVSAWAGPIPVPIGGDDERKN